MTLLPSLINMTENATISLSLTNKTENATVNPYY